MPTQPAEFREWISGRLPYTQPPGWRHEPTATGIRIIPVWKPVMLLSVFFLGFGVVDGFLFDRLKSFSHDVDDAFFAIPFLVVSIGIALATVVVGAQMFRSGWEILRGPYAIYEHGTATFSLPRERLRFNRADIVGWRVVSGNWIGPEDSQKRREKPMSELQLIVRFDGGQHACLVTGTLSPSITDEATEIARATGLPLEIVVQHQGIQTPAVRVTLDN